MWQHHKKQYQNNQEDTTIKIEGAKRNNKDEYIEKSEEIEGNQYERKIQAVDMETRERENTNTK